MTDDQKNESAKSYRELSSIELQFATRRVSELADEFTRLEVQIATILTAFAGLFLSYFNQKIQGLSLTIIFGLKFMYASGLFFLIASLSMGLIHIKRKEKWWDDMTNEKGLKRDNWIKATQGKMPFDEAKAFHNGTSLGKQGVVVSPKWTWMLQTICLGLAIILLFVLFLVFLFH